MVAFILSCILIHRCGIILILSQTKVSLLMYNLLSSNAMAFILLANLCLASSDLMDIYDYAWERAFLDDSTELVLLIFNK
jgi:hypothetical protein